jgi:hypothetical protein
MPVQRVFESGLAMTNQRVQLLATSMRVRDLNIDRPSILAYLRTIPPDKLEIALVHALEVGVKEIRGRRERQS